MPLVLKFIRPFYRIMSVVQCVLLCLSRTHIFLAPRLLHLLWPEGGQLGQRHRDRFLPAVQLVVEVDHVAPEPAVVPEAGAAANRCHIYI